MQNRNNPAQDAAARAPYNFVPLPDKVIYVPRPPNHNTFHADRLTGHIDVTLETRSPLYIRGPLTRQEFEQDGEQASKNNPAFFHTGNPEDPVIPGSSLRGMLRNIFEVITYSKMQGVSNERLFFRSVDNSSIGRAYRNRMVGNSEYGNKVEGGFLHHHENGATILKCTVVRVLRDTIRYESTGANATAPWKGQYHQHQIVWVRLGAIHLVEQISDREQPGWTKAMLVLTGNAPKKKKEFVFFFPEPGAEKIAVSDDIIERFHNDDQLTQYQEKAFPKTEPSKNPKPEPFKNVRERDGYLEANPNQPGDPVFFLREGPREDQRTLTFIGRAQMFRLPYSHTPLDFVPPELRKAEQWDMAEALFGRIPVKSGKKTLKGSGHAGRIFVTNATFAEAQENIWLPGVSVTGFIPKILSTPKPTTFQHYLEQPETVTKNSLHHYEDKPSRSLRLRGHKFYWHRGQQTRDTLRFTGDEEKFKKQLTTIRPLRAGLTFTFRIYFENLTITEVGALVWAIRLPDATRDCCHSLGMGKPLGMGAVKLTPVVRLSKRPERYARLFKEDKTDWDLPQQVMRKPENLAKLESAFQEFIEQNIQTPFQQLCSTGRLGDLLTLLEWKPQLSAQEQHDRDYMTLEEFRYRPVLRTVRNIRSQR